MGKLVLVTCVLGCLLWGSMVAANPSKSATVINDSATARLAALAEVASW